MGWWSQSHDGRSFADDHDGLVWGDGPADVMSACFDQIRHEFQRVWNREPTLTELRAGVEFTLRPLSEQLSP